MNKLIFLTSLLASLLAQASSSHLEITDSASFSDDRKILVARFIQLSLRSMGCQSQVNPDELYTKSKSPYHFTVSSSACQVLKNSETCKGTEKPFTEIADARGEVHYTLTQYKLCLPSEDKADDN